MKTPFLEQCVDLDRVRAVHRGGVWRRACDVGWRMLVMRILCLCVFGAPCVVFGQTSGQPNILFILADDMGFSDLGCYGSEVQTPHLDRLAREGLRFRRFYNQAKCEPSREAILTGTYEQTSVSKNSLNTTLRNGGYFTAFTGKIHGYGAIGTTDRRYTQDGGADSHWNPGPARPGEPQPARKEATIDASNRDGANAWTIDGVSYARGAYTFPADYYSTDKFADKMIEYLAATPAAKPFFGYLAFTAPHWPLHAAPADIALYRGKYLEGWDVLRQRRLDRQIALGLFPPGTRLSPRPPDIPAWSSLTPAQQDHYDHLMAIHAAMIHAMDRAIGRVLAQVESMGRLDNTLVIFLSDNGADTSEYTNTTEPISAEHPLGGLTTYYGFGPWYNLSNAPFRRAKTESHEGGVASSAILNWPARIPASLRGSWLSDTAHVIDLGPTLCDAGAVPIPASYEGRSFLPLLSGEPRVNPPDHYAFQNYATKGVIQGEWKLVAAEGRNWELYHLASDPAETTDLANAETARVMAMEGLWNAWAVSRALFPGRTYDGGTNGSPPALPPSPDITVSNITANGFSLAWPAATDANGDTLRYRAWWTLKSDASTVADFRTHGTPIGSLGTTRTATASGLVPGLSYRVTVLVQDRSGAVGNTNENPNVVAYPAVTVTLPAAGVGPEPSVSAPALLLRQPSSADLTWAAASDDLTLPSQLSYRLYKQSGSAVASPAEALARGALVADYKTALLSASAENLAGGEIFFSVLVRDASGNLALYPPASARFVGAPVSFAEWAANLGGPPYTDPAGDPDQDGHANLHEYAWLLDPARSDPAPLAFALTPSGALSIEFNHSQRDLLYAVEGSSDLAGWQTLFSAEGAPEGHTIFTDPSPGPRRFLRIRLSLK